MAKVICVMDMSADGNDISALGRPNGIKPDNYHIRFAGYGGTEHLMVEMHVGSRDVGRGRLFNDPGNLDTEMRFRLENYGRDPNKLHAVVFQDDDGSLHPSTD